MTWQSQESLSISSAWLAVIQLKTNNKFFLWLSLSHQQANPYSYPEMKARSPPQTQFLPLELRTWIRVSWCWHEKQTIMTRTHTNWTEKRALLWEKLILVIHLSIWLIWHLRLGIRSFTVLIKETNRSCPGSTPTLFLNFSQNSIPVTASKVTETAWLTQLQVLLQSFHRTIPLQLLML